MLMHFRSVSVRFWLWLGVALIVGGWPSRRLPKARVSSAPCS